MSLYSSQTLHHTLHHHHPASYTCTTKHVKVKDGVVAGGKRREQEHSGLLRSVSKSLLTHIGKAGRHRHLVVQTKASSSSSGGGESHGESFDVDMYHEASVGEVRSADKYGHVIFLRLKDGKNSILPVYIGEYECGSLIKEISRKTMARPGTHDLMRNSLEALGYRVSKVRITALIGNTYHARIHFARGRGIKMPQNPEIPSSTEVDVDSRPSDAINLAVRFGAPIYVNKEVASKMAHSPSSFDDRSISAGAATGAGIQDDIADGSASEIVKSCREEVLNYADPTIMHKLQLQLAIAEERFEDATRLRDIIEKMLASDRALALVVAIETALEDGRFEEAARLRDEFRQLRLSKGKEGQSHQNISDVLDF